MPLPVPQPRPLQGSIIQSAVNFSEGRRPDVIASILESCESVSGAVLADWSADFDHNRMVITLLGAPDAVCRAILAAGRTAVELIDLRHHTGAHPRAGAVDVVPLVPIREATIQECISASRRLGEELATTLRLPVYLYELSAQSGRRAGLPEIRKGGFEALFREPMDGDRAPDFGPSEPNPTAGITVVGARNPLVAFNIQLDSEDVSVARKVAAAIRRDRLSDARLSGVRALGIALASRGITQVSMNLTQPELTPIPPVFDYVSQVAAAAGAAVLDSEVIGLLPRNSFGGQSPERIRWTGYRPGQILENWLPPD